MSSPLNADLHCHSTCSDGTLAPAELARRAHGLGVGLWALTDHDDTAGLAEAGAQARELGLRFVPGVEISVSFGGRTVHLLGLGIDPGCPELAAGLAEVRAGREARAEVMARAVEQACPARGVHEAVLRHAGSPARVARTHFARVLVEQGICRDTREVFTRFLTPGKPGYVEHEWAGLEPAMSWIARAGGLAVIAHPGRYGFDAAGERSLFDTFRELGGVGVEVASGSHGSADVRKYTEVARSRGLRASRGSDFHSPDESRFDLGQLPPLPAGLDPIWDLLS